MKHQTTRKLDVPLSEEELAVKAQQLAATLARYDATEDEKKAVTQQKTKEMKELRAAYGELRREVTTRTTKKVVDCYQEPNVKRRVWEVRRGDTGAIVEQIPMSAAEILEASQLDLEHDVTASRHLNERA